MMRPRLSFPYAPNYSRSDVRFVGVVGRNFVVVLVCVETVYFY